MSYGTPPPSGSDPNENDPTAPGAYGSTPPPPPSSGSQDQHGYGSPQQPSYGQQPPPAYGQQDQPSYGAPQQPGGYPPAPQSPYGAAPQPGYAAAPPPYGGGPVAGPAPKNWLWLSIVTILFCWPLAIPAIVFSSQVNGKWASGDAAGAVSASSKARTFALIGIVVGVVVLIAQIARVAGQR